MKSRTAWILVGLLCAASFVLSMTKAPAAITSMLHEVASDAKSYSALLHGVFLVVLGLGLVLRKARDGLFSLFIAFLSLSATVVALIYAIVPNVIIFGTFFALIVHAALTKRLSFGFRDVGRLNLAFGLLGLLFGFWYLHWVESPVWLNALLYSPMGAANCPTMLVLCGFLCLTRDPRSAILDATVGLVTLYFGFFGIFRLGAYVDVALVLCGLFLIVRTGSRLSYAELFGGTREPTAAV